MKIEMTRWRRPIVQTAVVNGALALIVIGCAAQVRAQGAPGGPGGGSPPVGYAASDGIISPVTLYYNRSNWGYSPMPSGFTTDPDGNYLASCATAPGATSVSFSASLVYDIANLTGDSASNTIAVNIGAGGAVGAANSTYNATSTVTYGNSTYGNTTASGSVPDGLGNTTYADPEYSVITTVTVPNNYIFVFTGTATGSAYGPSS